MIDTSVGESFIANVIGVRPATGTVFMRVTRNVGATRPIVLVELTSQEAMGIAKMLELCAKQAIVNAESCESAPGGLDVLLSSI